MSLQRIVKKTKIYEIGLAQMLAAKSAAQGRNHILENHGLTSIEWLILGAVYDETPTGGVRVTDLANLFVVKSTYITSILRILKDNGYVETRDDPQDARVRRVVTTKRAAKAIEAIEAEMQAATEHKLSSRVTEEQFRSYVHVLQEIARVQD